MMRILLLGPQEELLTDDPEREYRKTATKSYEELLECGHLFGVDYTGSREFLGIECLASVLRENGYEVEIVSCRNEKLSVVDTVKRIQQFNPDCVGISIIYDLQLYSGLTIAREIKKCLPQVHIVFGGSLSSVIPKLLLLTFPFIDSIVKGEGEYSIVTLVDVLKSNLSWKTVPGLCWRSSSGIQFNPQGKLVDLDAMPVASRDVLQSMHNRNLPILNAYLFTSRGCKGRCSFCTVPTLARESGSIKHRRRDPVKVVDEMESIIKEFGVSTFYMTDDNFLGYGEESKDCLLTMAEEILSRKLKIYFHAECRADNLIPEVLGKLRKAGFHQILLGLESGSDKTLRRWGKGVSVEENIRAIDLVRYFHFDFVPSIILLDWESDVEEVEETVSFIEKMALYNCMFPLNLVNKLDVNCGTAASRCYEKKHGRPPSLPITDDISLRRWIVLNTYNDVSIDNPFVAEFWRVLNLETNRWFLLSNEVVPMLLLKIRRDKKTFDRNLIAACRLWRRNLGNMLIGLMRVLIDEVQKQEAIYRYPKSLTELARNYVASREKVFFPEGIDNVLWIHRSNC
jgi:radical SAM superfamily enzyme YgiQ (UPF0313 family)